MTTSTDTHADTAAADPIPGAPLLWMRGDRAALGPFTRELAELYWQWENEPTVIAGMGRQTPESLEARLTGYDAQARSMGTIPRFTIYDLTRDGGPVPVGTSALRIDHYVRTAEFIILLGADGRGRGLATEATRLTLDYAFTISALRSVWLKVLAPNTGAITAYEKAGFCHAGRLRRAGYWHGAETDELIMDAVADDHLATS
ncbi:GNAT family N-acetyltransferase [Pseudonocardia sp. C8]|uniref:GNAT family N-acetyltransferase n=1 Tax=Pseudonocardia sp. C8 TaxID=2762759 RepID=UPI001642AA0A|nr:GNAT family protein [Pseudonocardia sp. C8]MBC3189461.1 GNAT family N-acetyltransferase [Pseudonocardia sp. C8]